MTKTALAAFDDDDDDGEDRDPETQLVERVFAMGAKRADACARLGSTTPKCRSCNETDPLTLSISSAGRFECYECCARAGGRSTVEGHHMAGRHNDPDGIAALAANDHRALSGAQGLWPTATLRNPNASPLLAAAAALRGWFDTMLHIVERTVGWIPEFLERLDAWLSDTIDARWWTQLPQSTT